MGHLGVILDDIGSKVGGRITHNSVAPPRSQKWTREGPSDRSWADPEPVLGRSWGLLERYWGSLWAQVGPEEAMSSTQGGEQRPSKVRKGPHQENDNPYLHVKNDTNWQNCFEEMGGGTQAGKKSTARARANVKKKGVKAYSAASDTSTKGGEGKKDGRSHRVCKPLRPLHKRRAAEGSKGSSGKGAANDDKGSGDQAAAEGSKESGRQRASKDTGRRPKAAKAASSKGSARRQEIAAEGGKSSSGRQPKAAKARGWLGLGFLRGGKEHIDKQRRSRKFRNVGNLCVSKNPERAQPREYRHRHRYWTDRSNPPSGTSSSSSQKRGGAVQISRTRPG